jgi:hypothetical protein
MRGDGALAGRTQSTAPQGGVDPLASLQRDAPAVLASAIVSLNWQGASLQKHEVQYREKVQNFRPSCGGARPRSRPDDHNVSVVVAPAVCERERSAQHNRFVLCAIRKLWAIMSARGRLRQRRAQHHGFQLSRPFFGFDSFPPSSISVGAAAVCAKAFSSDPRLRARLSRRSI